MTFRPALHSWGVWPRGGLRCRGSTGGYTLRNGGGLHSGRGWRAPLRDDPEIAPRAANAALAALQQWVQAPAHSQSLGELPLYRL